MAFDPYHKWLAIPKEHRPPTYYQLLAVAPDETDVEVIEEAAIRQSTHLRAYQVGPHAEDCTRLLNEISAARSTLLNPAKRRAYDAKLGISQAVTAATPTAVTTAPPLPQFDLLDDEPAAVVVRRAQPQPLDIRRKHFPLLYVAIGGGVASLLLVILVIVLLTRPVPQPGPPVAAVGAKKPVPPEVNRLAPQPQDNGPAAPPNLKPRPPVANPVANPPVANPPVGNPPNVAGNVPRMQLPPVPPPGPFRQPDGPGVIRADNDYLSHLQFVPGQRKLVFPVNSNEPRKHGYCVWDIDAKAMHRWFSTDRPNLPSNTFCVAVSADGTWALGGEMDQLRRLDLVTGEDRILPWPGIVAREISLAPDGKQALVLGHFRDQNLTKIVLVDIADLQGKRELAADNSINIVGWTDAGQTAVIKHRQEFQYFERGEGRRTANFTLPGNLFLTGLSRDGNRLATWYPFAVRSFDLTRRGELFETPVDKGQAGQAPMLSADGGWIALARRNQLTRIDGKTGALERTWHAARGTIRAAALSADGAQALTWTEHDRALRHWDLNQPLPQFPAVPANLGTSHRIDQMTYLQVLPMEGDQCLRYENNELALCRLPTLERIKPLALGGLPQNLHAGGYQPPWVLLSSHDKITKINLTDGRVVHLPIAERNMRSAALSRTGKYLAVTLDRSLKLWDGAGQKLIAQRDDVQQVNGVVFFKNEERCLVSSTTGLHLMDLPTLATSKIWSSSSGNVALSPDERLAAFGAFNGVFVIDLTTDQFLSVVHTRYGSSSPTLAFLRGGTHLAYADAEAICIYNFREHKEAAYFPYEAGHIFQLDVASDGRTIITRRDGIQVWQVSKELLP